MVPAASNGNPMVYQDRLLSQDFTHILISHFLIIVKHIANQDSQLMTQIVLCNRLSHQVTFDDVSICETLQTAAGVCVQR